MWGVQKKLFCSLRSRITFCPPTFKTVAPPLVAGANVRSPAPPSPWSTGSPHLEPNVVASGSRLAAPRAPKLLMHLAAVICVWSARRRRRTRYADDCDPTIDLPTRRFRPQRRGSGGGGHACAMSDEHGNERRQLHANYYYYYYSRLTASFPGQPG